MVYVREGDIDAQVVLQLRRLRLDDDVLAWIRGALRAGHEAIARARTEAVARINGQIERLQKRIDTAYDDRLGGRIDIHQFEHRSRGWREEQVGLRHDLSRYEAADQALIEAAPQVLELAKRGLQLYESATMPNRRRLLGFLTSNFVWTPGTLQAVWREPFDILAESADELNGGSDDDPAKIRRCEKWQGVMDRVRTLLIAPSSELRARVAGILLLGVTAPFSDR